MTHEQREELSRITGQIDGLAWLAENTMADALVTVVQDLDKFLVEDKEKTEDRGMIVQGNSNTIVCSECKFYNDPIDEIPCGDCMHSHRSLFEPKEK